MGLNASQLREYVVRPALKSIGLHSAAAEELVMATAAHESDGFQYIHQLGNGPALGLFQMEPRTYYDIWNNYLAYKKDLRESVSRAIGVKVGATPCAERLIYDLRFAAIMCRIHYRRVKAPLPDAEDVWSMANYWKQYYNTELGKGTPQQFVDNIAHV